MLKNKDLKRRILEISYKHGLSHLGSCLTAVDIIDDIFQIKKPEEKFILSNGHAGLALYVVLEKYHGYDAEELFLKQGIHPDRIKARHYSEGAYTEPIDFSTGSLGQGLPAACGMALADRSKNVFCLISDGEVAEGSIAETLQFRMSQRLFNLIVYLNYNGYSAYAKTKANIPGLENLGVHVVETDVNQLPFLMGIEAHYHVMSEEEYNIGMEILNG